VPYQQHFAIQAMTPVPTDSYSYSGLNIWHYYEAFDVIMESIQVNVPNNWTRKHEGVLKAVFIESF